MSTSPRHTAAEHARRLVAILGRLQHQGEFQLEAMAEELGTTVTGLASDLTTLSVCGVEPRTPLDLVPVYLDAGVVHVWGDVPGLRGPVRLSPTEARALVAALDAAGFSAADPLTAKLLEAASTSFDAENLARSIRAGAASHVPQSFEKLANAIARGQVLEIEYHSDGAVAPMSRSIEPRSLFVDRGTWYLRAWCRSAAAERTFRVDRVRTITTTGEHFDVADDLEPTDGDMAFSCGDLPVAVLRFAPGEAFSERDWPGGTVINDSPDGSLLAEVPFAGTGWIARRVAARLGKVEALSPAAVRDAVRTFARDELKALSGAD